ncbi:MAG TPA: alpha/beta fold hydrolase, partial [Planctomycetota bacterium]|nr:alpha/beta fold hydrolase [Planctomycetota bacterium]
LDESAWETSTAYDRFGLPGGTGLLPFPTKVRFLKEGRVLWLGLDCTIPPDKSGTVPASAMDRELIEVWIDKGPSGHTFYQIMFEPKDAKVVTSWVPETTLAKGFQVKTQVRADGYTAEVRIDLDKLNDFGDPPGGTVGFNLARNCAQGWGSLAGIVGHVHKPNQFWTLDIAGTETPVAPKVAYRDPFKPDADVRKIADTLVAAWNAAGFPHAGKPWARMQVTIDALAWKINRDDAWAWGAKGELAVQCWRVLTGWREVRDVFPMPDEVRALEAQLVDYPDGPYPKTRWREDAYISKFDGTAQPYAIFVPETDDPAKRFPLVLALHGSGVTHRGEGAVWERYWDDATPYIKVRPKARWCGYYGPLAERDVLDVIDDVCAHHPVDESRITMVGYSAGGFAVLNIAAQEPHRFAGIVSISAGMHEDRPENLRNMRVLIVHGYNDPVVWFAANQSLSALRLRDVGTDVATTVFPATGHGIAVTGYEEPLLGYRRPAAPRSVSCLTHQDNPRPLRCYWVSLLRLISVNHQAGVRADAVDLADGCELRVQTANVAECALDVADVAKETGRVARLIVDGQTLELPVGDFCRLTRDGFRWKAEGASERPQPDPTLYVAGGVRNLFYEGSALIVAPDALVPFVEKLKRRQFYGLRAMSQVPVRSDAEVTDDELKSHHLILVGGPALNRVVKRLMDATLDWPLPRIRLDAEGGEFENRHPDGFLLYDSKAESLVALPLDECLVSTVTFNPLNRALRAWTILSDSADAFVETSPVIAGRDRWKRAADVVVVDVKTQTVKYERTLGEDWKPSRRDMRPE